MQKAPVIKGSGLITLGNKTDEEMHVFGSNLEERVVEANSIKFENPQNKEDDDMETIRNRKFEISTGEEDEETEFQGEFKLFTWDLSTSNWIEKGRGQLKLNESFDGTKSRIIMRISGTLRIILNVAIKSSFKVLASSKTNIRFTDGQNVWAASGNNSDGLKRLIEQRIERAAENEEEKRKRTYCDYQDEDNKDYDHLELKKKKAGDGNAQGRREGKDLDENWDDNWDKEEKDDGDRGLEVKSTDSLNCEKEKQDDNEEPKEESDVNGKLEEGSAVNGELEKKDNNNKVE